MKKVNKWWKYNTTNPKTVAVVWHEVYCGRDGSLERRFFIQNNYGGCQNDAGWFLVVEKDTCAWEQRTTRPYFLYSGLTGRDLQDSKFYRHLRLTERVSPSV